MKRKSVLMLLVLLSLSACGVSSNNGNSIASLYTGYEGGGWYTASASCSAQLCPPVERPAYNYSY